MVSVKTIIFFAASVSAAAVRRDAAQVITDLHTINSDTVALTTAVNNYQGGLFAAIPVENAESQLDSDVKSATTDANAVSSVSDADAQTVIDYINGTLEPNIQKTIAALEAKKSQIASAGLTGTVQSDLKTLKSDTDTLGNRLVAIAPADKAAAAQTALGKIDSDFAGAIAFFS